MPPAETQLQDLCRDEKWSQAATLAIETYGPEVTGYLMALARNESDVQDVFGSACEALWQGLPGFRWECSFRTWFYVLARHALARHARDPARRPGRAVPLSMAPEVQKLADRVRTATLTCLKTEVKDKVAELRARLDPEDQNLFILRINRAMEWRDIARVMAAEDEPGDAELGRLSAALRKRFERAKDAIRRMAREQGLLG
jgi:RNA polymerase sigma-70 factor (ECF subfamily)